MINRLLYISLLCGSIISCGGGGPGVTSVAPTPAATAVAIVTQPVSLTTQKGSAVTLLVLATGTNPTYQWRNGSVNINGATSAAYNFIADCPASGCIYSVVVSNSVNSVASAAVTVTVTDCVFPVAITTNPTNQAVNENQTATFTASASGTTSDWQWTKNNINIAGANTSSYTTPPVTLSDSGARYAVRVWNTSNSVISTDGVLTVIAVPVPITITTHPQSQSIVAGQTATFTAAATGTSPTYQWLKNGNNIAGAVGTTYTTPVTTTADSGTQYSVKVSNSINSLTSNVATLTVAAAVTPISITTQPQSQSIPWGQAVLFSVTASGTSPSYQWYRGGVAIGGATSKNYQIGIVDIPDNGVVFSVRVWNSANSVTSNNATLTVTNIPVAINITQQPTNQTINFGSPATFSVTVTGTNPNYQWMKGGANIAGATSSSYTFTPVAADNNTNYSVKITNVLSSVTSTSASLVINGIPQPIAISTHPANQTVTLGSPVTFSVVATGTSPTYQWYKNGVVIAGATSSSYTFTPVAADNGSNFYVKVTNTVNSITSNSASLTVNIPVGIAAQPTNQMVNVGNTVAFTVTPSGTTPITYQWYKNGVAVGSNMPNYSFSTVVGDNNASVYVKLTNVVNTVTSNTVTLTLTGLPTLDLTVGKIQLNQAIQMSDDSVPIVSGRDLVFRIYPLANQTNTAKPTIKVSIYNSGALLQTVSGTFPNSSVPLALDLDGSNVVELQVSGVNVKSGYTYTVVIDPSNLIIEANKTNNTVNGTLTTITVHSLPVNMVPLKIGSNVSSVTTIAGAQAKYGQNMKSVLPVSTINYTCSPIYTVTTTVANPAALNLQEIGGILLEVENKRLAEGGGVLYVGLYNSDGASASGVAFVPGFAALVQHGGMAMEHEITHLLGVSHVSCPGHNIGSEPSYPYANGTVPGNSVAIAGINPAAAMNPDASPRYDYMTYCFNWWVSDWTYKRVITAINSKGFSGAASIAVPMDSEAVVDAGESMLISGSYEVQSGNWSIGPAYNLGTYLDLNEENWEGNGLEVRVLDITGKVLAKKNFRLGVYCEELNLPFRHFSLRFNGNFSGAAEIQIVENGKVVASQKNNDSIDEPFSVRSSASHKTFVHSGKAAMVMDESGQVITVLHNDFEVIETMSDKFTIHVSNGVRSQKFEKRMQLQ